MSGAALFLSAEELAELTGYCSALGHVRWLDRNRWRYAMDRNNRPRVLRAYFEDRLGLASSAAAVQQAPAVNVAQPNFAALARR